MKYATVEEIIEYVERAEKAYYEMFKNKEIQEGTVGHIMGKDMETYAEGAWSALKDLRLHFETRIEI